MMRWAAMGVVGRDLKTNKTTSIGVETVSPSRVMEVLLLGQCEFLCVVGCFVPDATIGVDVPEK